MNVVPMETDSQVPNVQTESRGTKRTAEEELSATENNKKVKTGEKFKIKSSQHVTEFSGELKSHLLKRDRENCTIFVADLPNNVMDEDVHKLFSDVRILIS